MSYPVIFNIPKDPIYLCMIYEYKDRLKKKKICDCHVTYKEILSFELGRKHYPPEVFRHFLIMTDKNFILNEVFPLCDENIQKALKYSYTNNNDTIFRNILDYENKVIIDTNVFYYPLNLKDNMQAIRMKIESIEWFKSIMSETAWIQSPDCMRNKERQVLFIYIPFITNFVSN
jgi:hypothetical protein